MHGRDRRYATRPIIESWYCGCDIERLKSRIKYLLDQTFNTEGKCRRLSIICYPLVLYYARAHNSLKASHVHTCMCLIFRIPISIYVKTLTCS